ncbi:Chromosome partition protein MukB [Clarias magur]|uniref:Chromosome partition protein MukB n=1 Tax=Clarias magur TaxID=1594786 RepID=A0A8J4TJG0_CLAMG|nr:Chromosome partition protein MukB [Clarias magur]
MERDQRALAANPIEKGSSFFFSDVRHTWSGWTDRLAEGPRGRAALRCYGEVSFRTDMSNDAAARLLVSLCSSSFVLCEREDLSSVISSPSLIPPRPRIPAVPVSPADFWTRSPEDASPHFSEAPGRSRASVSGSAGQQAETCVEF